MTIIIGLAIFTAGASFGCVIAACLRGFARSNGEYDRATRAA
jgi:F0F1-type ATP synthase membrane subunit c/vacuolar-type H+-ATPase subunit K